eukprot:912309_1
MTSNERKQRTIKNSIVNIDNVSIDRGDDYVNWIHIVKQKLLEREISLLQQRREVCDAIIVSMIKMFATHHAEIFDKYNQPCKFHSRHYGFESLRFFHIIILTYQENIISSNQGNLG